MNSRAKGGRGEIGVRGPQPRLRGRMAFKAAGSPESDMDTDAIEEEAISNAAPETPTNRIRKNFMETWLWVNFETGYFCI